MDILNFEINKHLASQAKCGEQEQAEQCLVNSLLSGESVHVNGVLIDFSDVLETALDDNSEDFQQGLIQALINGSEKAKKLCCYRLEVAANEVVKSVLLGRERFYG